jgi:hypothetical protein
MSEKMQVVMLNKKQKEELVIKLYHENKTIRQIAEIVHMSFKDIGAIIRRINSHDNDKYIDTKLSNKSKATQALYLFEHGKKHSMAEAQAEQRLIEVFEKHMATARVAKNAGNYEQLFAGTINMAE